MVVLFCPAQYHCAIFIVGHLVFDSRGICYEVLASLLLFCEVVFLILPPVPIIFNLRLLLFRAKQKKTNQAPAPGRLQ